MGLNRQNHDWGIFFFPLGAYPVFLRYDRAQAHVTVIYSRIGSQIFNARRLYWRYAVRVLM